MVIYAEELFETILELIFSLNCTFVSLLFYPPQFTPRLRLTPPLISRLCKKRLSSASASAVPVDFPPTKVQQIEELSFLLA